MRRLPIRECLASLTGHLIVHLYGIDGLLVKSAEEAEAHYQKLPRGPGRTITFGTFTASKVPQAAEKRVPMMLSATWDFHVHLVGRKPM